MKSNKFRSFKSKVAMLLSLVLLVMSVPVVGVGAAALPAANPEIYEITASSDATYKVNAADATALSAEVTLASSLPSGVTGATTSAAISYQWYSVGENDNTTVSGDGASGTLVTAGAALSTGAKEVTGPVPVVSAAGETSYYMVISREATENTTEIIGVSDAVTITVLNAVEAEAINDVAAPIAEAEPIKTVSGGTGFSAKIAWKVGSDTFSDAKFAYDTAYTAELTLTALKDYAFPASFATSLSGFTVGNVAPTGGGTLSNDNKTLTFSVTFAATGALDKTKLTEAITAANTAKGTATEAADGSAIDRDKFWVTSTDMTALTNAINKATAAESTVKTEAEVTAAAGELDSAVTDFNSKKKSGTKIEPVTAITNVPQNGIVGEALTLEGVVKPDNATYKDIVWSIAEGGSIADENLALAVDKLTATVSGSAIVKATITDGKAADENFTDNFTITFTDPNPGVDYSKLEASIVAAEKAKNEATISVNGSEIAKTDFWVTQGDVNILTAAITTAENARAATTTDAANTAAGTLDAAVTTFNNAKKPGTQEDVTPTPTPVISTVSAGDTTIPATGGTSLITVTGTDLADGITVRATNAGGSASTITDTTAGGSGGLSGKTTQIIQLTFPENDTDADVVYTIEVSLDGSTDWVNGGTVTVSAANVSRTALEQAITDAGTLSAGVAESTDGIKDSADSSNLEAGEKYVLPAEKSALTTALSEAETMAGKTGVTQAKVDAATKKLTDTFAPFADGTSKKAVEFILTITDPDAITEANGSASSGWSLPATVAITTNGSNTEADVVWVKDDTTTGYDAAKTDAQSITINGTITLPGGVEDKLTPPVGLATTITVNVLSADDVRNDLAKKINEAEAAVAGIAASDNGATDADGKVLSVGDEYVTVGAMNAFDAAIAAANALGGTATEAQVEAAIEAIEAALVPFANPEIAVEFVTEITPPPAITVDNGTPSADWGLPEVVSLITNGAATTEAAVSWTAADYEDYDAAKAEEQKFDISGNVTPPTGIANNNNVALITNINVTVSAKTGGTPPDIGLLQTAIADAKAKLAGVIPSDDGSGLNVGDVWASQADIDMLQDEIDAAQAFLDAVTDETQAEVDAVLATLEAAIDAFVPTTVADSGAVIVDYTALEPAIADAQDALVGIKQSADGSDVDPEVNWVTAGVWNTFNAAINAANALIGNAASQAEVDDAVAALQYAVKTFVAAQKPGTKVNPVVEEALKDIIAGAADKAASEILADIAKIDFVAMTNALDSVDKTASLVSTLEQLEKIYNAKAGVTLPATDVNPNTHGDFQTKASQIKVVGAGLNAIDGAAVQLHFSKPTADKPVSANHSPNTAVQVEITITGVADPQALRVPIFVTVPIPTVIKADSTFQILHHHANGEIDTINPTINGDGTCSFAVTGFSTFVFINNVPVYVPPVYTPTYPNVTNNLPNYSLSSSSTVTASKPAVTYTVTASKEDGQPLAIVLDLPVKTDKNGNTTFTVTNAIAQKAITKAKAETRKLTAAEKKDGTIIEIVAAAESTVNGMTVRIDKAVLQSLASTTFGLAVYSDAAFVALDNDAIKELVKTSNSYVRFSARPVKQGSAMEGITGGHPAYNVLFKDAKGKDLAELKNGTVTFGIYYEASDDDANDNPGVIEIDNNKGSIVEDSFLESGWLQWEGNANGVFSSGQYEDEAPPAGDFSMSMYEDVPPSEF